MPIRSIIVGIVDAVERAAHERAARRARLVADYARACTRAAGSPTTTATSRVRLGAGRFLATPTATSKAAVTADRPARVVDESGASVVRHGQAVLRDRAAPRGLRAPPRRERRGPRAPARTRPAIAVRRRRRCSSGRSSPRRWSRSAPAIPKRAVRRARRRRARAALAPFVRAHDAVLIGNHGVFAWGADARAGLPAARARRAPGADRARAPSSVGGVGRCPSRRSGALLEARRKALPAARRGPSAAGASGGRLRPFPAPPTCRPSRPAGHPLPPAGVTPTWRASSARKSSAARGAEGLPAVRNPGSGAPACASTVGRSTIRRTKRSPIRSLAHRARLMLVL